MNKRKYDYRNRELSWLSFNERVLQEAEDKSVPLIERIKFLGIFSSNRDEFFRVRVATMKRLANVEDAEQKVGYNPDYILNEIQHIVIKQARKFDKIYEQIIQELKKEKIFILDETQLNESHRTFIRQYFHDHVITNLTPIMLDSMSNFPMMKNDSIYLAVRMTMPNKKRTYRYALMEIPTGTLKRFVLLPPQDDNQFIIRLDDIIRFNLSDVFAIFEFDDIEAYTIKVTRDAELDLDSDEPQDFIKVIEKSLQKRKSGAPVRLTYDSEMPKSFLNYFIKKLKLKDNDAVIAGGRYHNSRDLMKFPKVGGPHLVYPKLQPIPHERLINYRSILHIIRERDFMLSYPYQQFNYFIELMRQASIDPKVKTIKTTVYRLANDSKVARALVNAARNGKEVTAIVELRARFDEENNIQWAEKFKEEGITVQYGFEDKKVHTKTCLIRRREGKKLVFYSVLGTGNFNESTANLYCDDVLFTYDQNIGEETDRLFEFMLTQEHQPRLKHLLISPNDMERRFLELIKFEIDEKNAGRPAKIIIKLNNLMDEDMIDALYEASQAGIEVDIIVRSTCGLIPEIEGISDNIRIISIIDKFLEHSRIFYFRHGGEEKIYISSADWMRRNLKKRVEVSIPIYDDLIKADLKRILEIQLADNQKARIIDANESNKFVSQGTDLPVRAQEEIYHYFQNKVEKYII